MNFLRSVPTLVREFLRSPLISLPGVGNCNVSTSSVLGITSLMKIHRDGPYKKPKRRNTVLDGRPFLKGIVLRTLIRKPRKPNSANRKCVLVKLSNGKEAVAFVPGIGHNLQVRALENAEMEHQYVLVSGKGAKDLPGVKVRCVRGAYDLPHVGK